MPSGQRASCSISAVLPAFNEEAIIERTVRHVADVLRAQASDFEIIVSNDGSRDNTAACSPSCRRASLPSTCASSPTIAIVAMALH
jgi:hypothetical protein